MATEQEELRLVVTLDDQASAQLVKLKAAMQELGGGVTAESMERLRRQTQDLARQLRPLREDSERASSATLSLAKSISTVASSVAGFLVAQVGIDKLRAFTQEMIQLDQLSKTTGVGVGQLKGAIDQMAQAGMSRGGAAAAIQAITDAIAGMSMRTNQLATELARNARTDPEAMQRFIERLIGFSNAGDLKSAVNEIMRAYNSVVSEGIAAGLSGIEAATQGKSFIQLLGLSPEILRATQTALESVTAEQEAAIRRQIAVAKDFNKEWEKTQQWINDITAGIQTGLLPVMTQFNTDVRTVGEAWGQAIGAEIGKSAGDLTKIYNDIKRIIDFVSSPSWEKLKGLADVGDFKPKIIPGGLADTALHGEAVPGAPAQPAGWERLNPFNPANIERERVARERAERERATGRIGGIPPIGDLLKGAPLAPGAPGNAVPLLSGQRDRWSDLPMSTNIEDRRGEEITEQQTDSLKANTDELKRLNEFLTTTNMGGAPAGALGFLGTQAGGLAPGYGGGTGVAGPVGGPMGGLPGMGGGGEGAEAAGGAPGAGGAAPTQWPTPAGNVIPPGLGQGPGIGGGPGGGAGAGLPDLGTGAGIAAGVAGLPGGPSGAAVRGPGAGLDLGFGGGAGGGIAGGMAGLPGGPSGPAGRGPGAGIAAGVAGLPGGPSGPAVRGPGAGMNPWGGTVVAGAGGAYEGQSVAVPPGWGTVRGGGGGPLPAGSGGSGVYNKLLAGYRSSSLIGKVPAWGPQFGIKTGSAEEWARFGTAVAAAESDFNPNQGPPSRTEKSYGIFQYDHTQVPGRNAFDVDASVKAFVRDSEQSSQFKDVRQGLLGQRFSTIGSHPDRTVARMGQAERAIRAAGQTGTADAQGAPPTGGGGVREAQAQVAGVRKGALDPRLRDALAYASEQTGLRALVTSGGQRMAGAPGATGSHRHDLGRAGDFNLVDEKGNTVSPNDPRALRFAEEAATAGAGGAGASYMSDPTKIHMGITGSGAEVGKGLGAYAGSAAFRAAVARGIERSKTEQVGILAAQQERRGLAERGAGSRGVPHLAAQQELDRQISGRELDKTPSVNVNGSGKISVEVKAPAGAKTSAEGDGLFKKTEISRQVQMEPAAGGPSAGAGDE